MIIYDKYIYTYVYVYVDNQVATRHRLWHLWACFFSFRLFSLREWRVSKLAKGPSHELEPSLCRLVFELGHHIRPVTLTRGSHAPQGKCSATELKNMQCQGSQLTSCSVNSKSIAGTAFWITRHRLLLAIQFITLLIEAS